MPIANRPAPADVARPDDASAAVELTPTAQAAALAYIERTLDARHPFAVLGVPAGSLGSLLDETVARLTRDDVHVVRVAPANTVHDFLMSTLSGLGFDLEHAALDDMHHLLIVFLRHACARGRRTLLIVEEAERAGPRVLEYVQTLWRVRVGRVPALTILLSGTPELYRVVDSAGMSAIAPMTRDRHMAAEPALDSRRAPLRVLEPARDDGGRAPRAPVSQARTLAVILDGRTVARYTLQPGQWSVGRAPESHIRLQSRYVSRHHALLNVDEASTVIVDLHSTNATLVNGQIIDQHVLTSGDSIAIGNFRLRYGAGSADQTLSTILPK